MRLSTIVMMSFTVALGVVTAAPASASSPYAPLSQPGPQLSVPTTTLDAALECSGDFARSTLQPVLLNPATGVTVDENFSWNYERAFTAQKRPWCAIHMPAHTLGDIQVAGEYLVHAIRTMRAKSTRDIAVLGHSQGGMSMRWALRFWPDTRSKVDDIIGMAASNHGTTVLPSCIVGLTSCLPAVWQQQDDAAFIEALNSRAETFKGVSYTEVYTHTDEVVQPNSDSATASPPCTPARAPSRTSRLRTCARSTSTSTSWSARSTPRRTPSRWTRSTTPARHRSRASTGRCACSSISLASTH